VTVTLSRREMWREAGIQRRDAHSVISIRYRPNEYGHVAELQ
jgi:hypothetical protein